MVVLVTRSPLVWFVVAPIWRSVGGTCREEMAILATHRKQGLRLTGRQSKNTKISASVTVDQKVVVHSASCVDIACM